MRIPSNSPGPFDTGTLIASAQKIAPAIIDKLNLIRKGCADCPIAIIPLGTPQDIRWAAILETELRFGAVALGSDAVTALPVNENTFNRIFASVQKRGSSILFASVSPYMGKPEEQIVHPFWQKLLLPENRPERFLGLACFDRGKNPILVS